MAVPGKLALPEDLCGCANHPHNRKNSAPSVIVPCPKVFGKGEQVVLLFDRAVSGLTTRTARFLFSLRYGRWGAQAPLPAARKQGGKKMKARKLISLALALILLLALFPTTATAAGDDYKTWNQGDDRWSSLSIAGNASAGSTTSNIKLRMGNSGCYITATCKLLIHSGQQSEDFTPAQCLEALKKYGLISNGGDLSFSSNKVQFTRDYTR